MRVAWREVAGRTEARLTESCSKSLDLISVPSPFFFPWSVSQRCRSSSQPTCGLLLWASFFSSYVSCGLTGLQAFRSLPPAADADSELPAQPGCSSLLQCLTYYCLLTCIYSFPKNPEEYISFLLNIKLENMLMFKKLFCKKQNVSHNCFILTCYFSCQKQLLVEITVSGQALV